MAKKKTGLEGFDPLAPEGKGTLLEAASKRIILNILKSYAGYYDIFNEPIQNALDSLLLKSRKAKPFTPKIWIEINIRERYVRIVDNGVGMGLEEFKFCLSPNVSFKQSAGLRGNKGVGATFLAYGFSVLELQSRSEGGAELAARLRQGRAWALDEGGSIPRPTLEEMDFSIPELTQSESGVSVRIVLSGTSGEKPKDLGWLGASTADQWFDILRIKTPLGGIYLTTSKFKPQVKLTVVAADGSVTVKESNSAEYLYPHELPVIQKSQDLKSLNNALSAIPGDTQTKEAKLAPEFKRLDCIYEVWTKDDILGDLSPFKDLMQEDESRQLVERHSVAVYGAFLSSAKLWTKFNEEGLRVRKGIRLVHGGMQLASDNMVQGDLYVIPLTSAIGYQNNSHIIIHFTEGSPDMGRKVFQPELKGLADALAIRAVTTFKKYLGLLKSDVGVIGTPGKDLYEWKKQQESYRDTHPLSLKHGDRQLSLGSVPQQEQDVVALFHELLGMGVLKGYHILATSSNERYDSLVISACADESHCYGDKTPLGMGSHIQVGQTSHPMVLEYKLDFASLVEDFSKDIKSAKEVNLAVVWSADKSDYEGIYLQSLLVGDEGSSRSFFGATHQAYLDGHQSVIFEVLVLRDLIQYLVNPHDEIARQKTLFK